MMTCDPTEVICEVLFTIAAAIALLLVIALSPLILFAAACGCVSWLIAKVWR